MPMHDVKLFFIIYCCLKGKENDKPSVGNLEGGCGKEKEGNKGQCALNSLTRDKTRYIWLLLPTQAGLSGMNELRLLGRTPIIFIFHVDMT